MRLNWERLLIILSHRFLIKNCFLKFAISKKSHFLIFVLIFQKYPLNSTEKLKYSLLLETLANISIQMNDFESSLRYFIKSIEILEDLYATFHLVELNKKFKTKMQLFQISNRLCMCLFIYFIQYCNK